MNLMNKSCFIVLLCALTVQFTACADDNNQASNNPNPPVSENNDKNNGPNNTANNDVGNDTNNDTNNDVEKPTLPTLTILSPKNAAILEGESVEFEIRIEDGAAGGVSWKINDGTPAQEVIELQPGDVFKQIVNVESGLNTLQITLHTNDGRRVSEIVVFQLNAVAKPVITLTQDVPALVQTEQVEFAASITAASGLAEHRITVNDVDVTDKVRLTELDANEAGGSVYELVGQLPLTIGTNEIVVSVVANNGAKTSLTVNVSREEDTESPVIAGLFPYNGQSVQTSRATIFGTVSDNVAVQRVQFKLGEISYDAQLLADGRFSVDIPLSPGANQIAVTAVDTSENSLEITHSIYFGNRTSSGGAHGGVIVDKKLYAWGRNQLGQVGLGFVSTPPDANHPDKATHVAALSDVVSIAFNQNGSIALTADGSVYGWADNGKGQLCLGTAGGTFDATNRHTPEKVTELSESIVAVTRGYSHTLLLTKSGTVLSCGDNSAGQLGDGTTENRDIPTPVQGLTNIIGIVGGSASSYAIAADGTVYTWGRNTYANLGNGSTHANPTPVAVPVNGLENVIGLASGRDHVIAITRNHELYGWGLNASNQVGEGGIGGGGGTSVLAPVLLDYNAGKPTQVRANGNQSFLFAANGRAYGWGQNGSGNLGIPADFNPTRPGEPVFGIENISDLGIGVLQGVALRADGRVFSWGWSFQGSLGGGSSIIDRWGYRIPVLVEFAK